MTSKEPVDVKFAPLMDVLSRLMDFEIQVARRMGRTVEKRAVPLRHLTKLAEFFRIPGKFPIKVLQGWQDLPRPGISQEMFHDQGGLGTTWRHPRVPLQDNVRRDGLPGFQWRGVRRNVRGPHRKHRGNSEAYGERVCPSPGATLRSPQRTLHRAGRRSTDA